MKVQKLFIELHTSRLLDVAGPYPFNVKTVFSINIINELLPRGVLIQKLGKCDLPIPDPVV